MTPPGWRSWSPTSRCGRRTADPPGTRGGGEPEDQRHRPRCPRPPVGGPATALAGVPFLIKDLAQDYAGSAHVGRVPGTDVDASPPSTPRWWQRWIDAGLVIFGKTNMPEFGAKGISEPVAWGPARNPWDLRAPAGCLGGSAAPRSRRGSSRARVPTTAAGRPASRRRAAGWSDSSPARGLTPMGPATGESMHGAAVQGVVSRTVRDTAAMLDVIAGGEPSGPYVPGAGRMPPYASAGGRRSRQAADRRAGALGDQPRSRIPRPTPRSRRPSGC